MVQTVDMLRDKLKIEFREILRENYREFISMKRPTIYRRRRGDPFWHFCLTCPAWPTEDFDEMKDANIPPGFSCLECVRLMRQGECDYETEDSSE